MAGFSNAVIWDPAFLEYDFGPSHPFQQRSRALAVRVMEAAGLFNGPSAPLRIATVEVAPTASAGRFHSLEYLEFVGELDAAGARAPLDSGDTPSFPGCLRAALRVVGGALRALEAVASGESRRAFHPAGGLHHAHPGRASGFCILNDVAVAIAHATGSGGPYRRVAYIDIDAHHGDGVMYGFYESGRLLDIDFHQDGRTLFPGTGALEETGRGDGAGLKVNVPLPVGAGDATIGPVFERVVPPLLRSYRPELIVLQHGVDGHVGDPLAALRYTPALYARVVEILLTLSDELCGGRLLVTGGGGYAPAHVARVLARTGFLLTGLPAPIGPLPEGASAAIGSAIGEPVLTTWIDRTEIVPETDPTASVERIVAGLSRHLGQRFPVP